MTATESTPQTTAFPDATGHYGRFGGRFVPEALIVALDQLDAAFRAAKDDPEFQAELASLQTHYTGRPNPVTECARFGAHAGGARVLLKREDLNHTGSHKINNVLGQALLTRRWARRASSPRPAPASTASPPPRPRRCSASSAWSTWARRTPAARRSTSPACSCSAPRSCPSMSGSRTLKDAINEAMRDWVTNVDSTHYLLGTVTGPAPFPEMVREFHRIIGVESREQVLALTGRLPDAVVACVGGGSNAIGIFTGFLDDASVQLHGYEAGGDGVDTGSGTRRAITGGSVGVLHGQRSFVLQDEDGQTVESHSISAGLDYPGVGPEHAFLAETGRATYEAVTDAEAMEAFRLLCRTEGIIPAIETAHALAGAIRLGKELGPDGIILVNCSGRGDKDVETASRWFGILEGERAPEGRA